VRANRLAAAAALPAGRCHLYNVGAGAATSVNELWNAIARLAGAGPEVSPVHAPPRAGDVRDSLASIERARSELGFQPAHTVASGLAATLPSYRDSLRAAR
jgi:UDP-glucose 4-epimerase